MTNTTARNAQDASPRQDIYTRVTQQIIAAIEAGTDRWKMPWHITEADGFAPQNAASKRPYRGVNVLCLWATAEAMGYPTGLWATYNQWRDLNAQVKKGEKSTLVVFWRIADGTQDETEDDQENADGRGGKRFFARGYCVFNAAQVDGFTPPALPARPQAERTAVAETFFQALGADIRHGGSRAFYNKAQDFIQLPRFEAFPDPVAYYATLAHECVHYTGPASRLDRNLTGRFGDDAYAAEELIAELGAAYLCAQLGLANEPRPDHAAYLQSWLKILKADSRAIFTAASKAQAAADWMTARQNPPPA